ncbi:MAG: inositol monophosphatase [Betaproteobacteria bacterium]|nr:inositol monophosphatase [Betaproteobacteria bacterium]
MNFGGANVVDVALAAEVCAVVRDVAVREVMPRYRRVGHRRKADGSLLTEADLAAQAALAERLRALVPLPFVGEEMSPDAQRAEWARGAAGLWCVDPIDGTSNFARGIPYFAISVALMRGGRSVLGVVYAPFFDEMFLAEAGAGAFLNGEPIACDAAVPALESSVAHIDFKRVPGAVGSALASAPPYCSHRSLGSATLEWCYLAASRIDVYVHGGQKLWDYAAGSLILSEAGGSVGTLDSADFWSGMPWTRSVIAARDRALYDSWRRWIDEQRR